jgi:hypothetical protein
MINHSLIIFYKNKTTQMACKYMPNALVRIKKKDKRAQFHKLRM